jgi:hypothetical protein
MAQPDFYNENKHRHFPFLAETASDYFPQTAIVDCGFLFGVSSCFTPGTHKVWLATIARSGSTFTFTFKTDSPELATYQLVFTRTLSDDQYAAEHKEAHSSSCGGTLWSGYLVTGDLTELAAVLASGSSLTGVAVVEPALSRPLTDTSVDTLNLANADRTRFAVPTGCNPQQHATPPQPIWITAACLRTSVKFQSGYNTHIELDPMRNALTFHATKTGGEGGKPCGAVPVYAGEVPPTGQQTLDGAYDCREVFRTIRGVAGPHLNFLGRAGVAVSTDPANHTVVIDANMQELKTTPITDSTYTYTGPGTPAAGECGELP